MRVSRKLVVTLGLTIGLVTVGVPVQARGAPILGTVNEGATLTINDIIVTNPNAFAVTLSTLDPAISNSNVMGDPGDFALTVAFALAGGTCLNVLAVNGGFAANAICTVNLTFTTPPADTGEPVDFGVSEITLSYRFNNGPVLTNIFDVQVNDVPVPEPAPATMVGLGVLALLGASGLQRSLRCLRAGRSSP